jgi:hypothetical protein
VNTFVAAFGNGVLLVFDKDKDDSQKNSAAMADASGVYIHVHMLMDASLHAHRNQ